MVLLANVCSCLAALWASHGDASDSMKCTSVANGQAIAPNVVRESFTSGGMNFCLVPSVWGVTPTGESVTPPTPYSL